MDCHRNRIRVMLNKLPEEPYTMGLWGSKVVAVWEFVWQRYGSDR